MEEPEHELHDYEYYAERIWHLCVTDPYVNVLDRTAVLEHAREKANELCLEPGPILNHVEYIHVNATADQAFQKASELREAAGLSTTGAD